MHGEVGSSHSVNIIIAGIGAKTIIQGVVFQSQ